MLGFFYIEDYENDGSVKYFNRIHTKYKMLIQTAAKLIMHLIEFVPKRFQKWIA